MRHNEQLVIEGGNPISGIVRASGSKNACLPIITATILATGNCKINNIPHLLDITSIFTILTHLDANICLLDEMSVQINTESIVNFAADDDLVSSMRASILILGPLLAKHKQAKMAMPGGCAIGDRPINMHIEALRSMQAEIEIKDNTIIASAPNGLQATNYTFDTITVTGTENVIMAASLANGTSIFKNCAREPEVENLIKFLQAMGAKIEFIDTTTIKVIGVKELQGCEHDVIADRIEIGTFLSVAIATGGSITIKNVDLMAIGAVQDKLQQMGAIISYDATKQEMYVEAKDPNELQAVDIVTEVYPGFPTDMQAQLCVLNCLAQGSAAITETIFENRFSHCYELQKMNAKITIDGNKCLTVGSNKLQGAIVQATDLRASACLVIAALAATGTSHITNVYHLDRGYELIEEKLMLLGAKIKRIST